MASIYTRRGHDDDNQKELVSLLICVQNKADVLVAELTSGFH